MTRARFLMAGLILALAPRNAAAQLDTFVQTARSVAASARQDDPERTTAIREALPRMTAALAEWDRSIKALEMRADRELTSGPSLQRTYQLHLELGVTYRARGRLGDALRELDAAATLQPSGSDLQLLRALTLEAMGRPDDAGRAFRAAWNLDAMNPVKAYYALQRGGLTAAPDRERVRAVLVSTYRQLAAVATRPAAAPFLTLDVLADTLSPTPIVGDGRTAGGFALLAAGRYSDGVKELTRAAQGTGGAAGDAPLAHLARAQTYEAGNQVPEARREYAAALAGALAGRSVIHVALARLAQVEGDPEGAIDALRRAVQLNPNDPTIHLELANAYATAGRVEDAFVELVGGLLINPANAPLHGAIGQLQLDAGHPEEAIPAFSRALELDPDRYEPRYGLAMALTRMGRLDEAAQQLQAFERIRREMLDRRRQDIRREVESEEFIRRGLSAPDATP